MVEENLLIEYAMDLLDTDERRQCERRLADDPDARARLQTLLTELCSVALTTEPVRPCAELRDRLVTAASPQMRRRGMVDRLADFFDLPAERAASLLARADEVPGRHWQRLSAGIHLMSLDGGGRRAEQRCLLVSMEPDTGFPPHRHLGEEWALLLDGYVEEMDGREYFSGDLALKAVGSTHSFRTGEAPCLFAVVLSGDIEWTSS